MSDNNRPWSSRETLRRLYWDENLSQREIAELYGTTRKVLWRLFVAYGIPTRKPREAKKAQFAKMQRRGDITYSGFHYRVAALYGKPQRCEDCGTTDPAKRYDWANLTGRYDDPTDYRRMCRSCHRRYDYARSEKPRTLAAICRNGHPKTEEDTYVAPNGVRHCRVCRRNRRPRYREWEKAKERAARR